MDSLNFSKPFNERQKHIENLLCAFLNMKTVVAFIGAGTSIPLGHPSWGGFAKDIFELLRITLQVKDSEKSIAEQLCAISIKSGTKPADKNLTQIKKAFSPRNSPLFQEEYSDDDSIEDRRKKKKLEKDTINSYLESLAELIKKNYGESKNKLKHISENYKDNLKNFERLQKYLDHKKSKELDFQTIFCECERMLCSVSEWESKKYSPFFRILVQSYFEIKRKKTTAKYKAEEKIGDLKSKNFNPYLALLELPIKKFATFNYDLEIERAIIYKKNKSSKIYNENSSFEQIIKESEGKSFSQEKYYCPQLAKFSISRFDDSNDMVFHCHGRVDDTMNCVITEEDYQKWYLREDKAEFIPFRQTLEIVLESNPILFLGFSLNDPDFMRILRRIAANRPIDKTRKPIFCFLYILENEIRDEFVKDEEAKLDKSLPQIEKDEKKKKIYEKAEKSAKWNNQKELEDECTMLYIKYGLHVIPIKERDWKYKLDESLSNDEKKQLEDWRDLDEPKKDEIKKQGKLDDFKGQAICNKLLDINQKWGNWWKGIVQKPKFRKFNIPDQPSYFHYRLMIDNEKRIKGFDKKLFEELDQALNLAETITDQKEANSAERKGFAENIALVIGDGGTGKSWSVQHYLETKEEIEDHENRKYKIFYWSSYYANDVLTGIDRLVDFLGKPHTPNSRVYDKFDLLKEILDDETNTNTIVVFDGIEKLLKPNKENTEGESANPEVRKFFKIITNKKVKCRIILTSRLFPKDIFYNIEEEIRCEDNHDKISDWLEIKNKIKKTKIFSAPKCWAIQLKDDSKYLDKVNEDYINANFKDIESFYSYISALFDGHVFAISLIKGILEDLDDIDKTELLLTKIINTPIEHCVNRVIKEAIENLNGELNGDEKIYTQFIERISLFMHPIRIEVAEVCLSRISHEEPGITAQGLMDKLLEKNLIQECRINNEVRYVVHPLIRSYIFETLHQSRFSSLPGLQLPGITSSKEIVDPGNKRGQKVSLGVFEALCQRAKEISHDDSRRMVASDLCRAAFSVIRSRFSTNTVCRWGNYTDYIKNLILLFDTAKLVSKEHWDFNEPTKDGFILCSDESAPLYSDELAWIYNEIGISLFGMGDMLQSAALLGEGYEINRLIDKEFEGRYIFQSNINKGAVNLHYGKLNTSMNYLQKASEIANKLENNSLIGRVLGYMATVKYLRGSLEEANIEFNNSYNTLDDNLRAKSTFLTAHGELLFKLKKYDEAIEKIEQSRHIAESVYYPDLVAYAKLSRANYYVHKGDHVRAQNEFQQVLLFAKEKHLRRLESATLSGMSRLAEKLGDYSTAVSRATEALKISNEYSLKLHQTLSLIVLGVALINGNQHRELGIACLKAAKKMAQKQEYFLRLNEAQEELDKYDSTNQK